MTELDSILEYDPTHWTVRDKRVGLAAEACLHVSGGDL
jgi:hypothetical protein